MKTIYKLMLVLFLAIAVSVNYGYAQKASLDQQVPDFSLKDAHGKMHKLSDYKGKYVVLEWVNFGCPFVRKHYDSGNMQALQKKYTDKGVVWFSICSSAPGKQGNFSGDELLNRIKNEKMNSTAYLVDEDGTVGKMFGAKSTPHMFIIDPKGNLIYAGGIDDKPSTNKADIDGAYNYVAKALDASMNGKMIEKKTAPNYGCSVKY